MKKMVFVLGTILLCQLAGAQPPVIKGDFDLKNVHTGMYVRIKDANGTPIVAYSPVNWKCVTWEFKPFFRQDASTPAWGGKGGRGDGRAADG